MMLTSSSWSQLLGGLLWFWLLLGMAYLSTRWPRWKWLTMLVFLAAPLATLITWASGPTRADGLLGETTLGFVLFWIAFVILFMGASVGWFVFGVWQRGRALSSRRQTSTDTLLPIDDLFSSTDSSLGSLLLILPFVIGALIGRLIGVDETTVMKRGVHRTGMLLFLATNAVMCVAYILFRLLDMPRS